MSDRLIVTMKAESLLARLAGTHDRLMADLRVVVRRLAIKAQGKVKSDKLTGQVLHVRTGTLRRSINQKVEETSTGVFAKVGTNLRYAAIHEYGFDGIENVRAHVRKQYANAAMKLSGKSHGGIRTWARDRGESTGSGQVKAHTRHMVMPKRSFLVSTLNEMGEEIRTSLRATILQAVRP